MKVIFKKLLVVGVALFLSLGAYSQRKGKSSYKTLSFPLSEKHWIPKSDNVQFVDYKSIKAVTFFLIDYIKPFRDFVTVNILIPIRNFYQAMPWSVVMALIAVGAHRLGGWKLVGVTCGMFFFIIAVFWYAKMSDDPVAREHEQRIAV